MEHPSNVILLLLQIVLKRQQALAHQDKSLELDTLLKEPVIDRAVLTEFQEHKLVKMYSPDLQTMQLRSLKGLISEILQTDVADSKSSEKEPMTVITLANHYYTVRIREIQESQLPLIRERIIQDLQSYS